MILIARVMWRSRYMKEFSGPSLTLYLNNIAVEPCFLDTSFLTERVAAIASVCNHVQEIGQQAFPVDTPSTLSMHPWITVAIQGEMTKLTGCTTGNAWVIQG
jgi:hypothetical protein